MYKTVYNLSRDQLDELKRRYFMELEEREDFLIIPSVGGITAWDKLPDDFILSEYANISFTDDDFFCTAGEG